MHTEGTVFTERRRCCEIADKTRLSIKLYMRSNPTCPQTGYLYNLINCDRIDLWPIRNGRFAIRRSSIQYWSSTRSRTLTRRWSNSDSSRLFSVIGKALFWSNGRCVRSLVIDVNIDLYSCQVYDIQMWICALRSIIFLLDLFQRADFSIRLTSNVRNN